jgi:hypothetical protein
MRIRLFVPWSLSVVVGCGTGGASGFDGGPDVAPDAGRADRVGGRDAGQDATIHLFDGSGTGDGCTGLVCKKPCATTTISGRVYDPAGKVPLYDVFVYVPNASLDPIPSGPTCSTCQAPASGSPIVSATTASDGTFSIQGAPDGANIPVVLQLGKWRRHLTLPKVEACKDNVAPDGFYRLPRRQRETSPDDNIPLIAFTTGCDGAECFLKGRIGIDLTEFTDATGAGRVHVYKSTHDNSQIFSAGAGVADALWTSSSEMMKYDIVFDACECNAYDRGGAGTTDVGYKNFLSYLDMGGRAFTTHFFYNFFTDPTQCVGSPTAVTCQGQDPLPTVGVWQGNEGIAFAPDTPDCPNDSTLPSAAGGPGSCMSIDTAIPKGKAFADWYSNNNALLALGGGELPGYVGLTDLRTDMGQLDSTLLAAGTATPWLYAGDLTKGYDSYYFSINTPVGTDATKQCGRAIFSDVHVSGGGGSGGNDAVPVGGVFPSYCIADADQSDHAPNELALEFLFFDLSSCVQDDRKPPPPPPPK